MSSPHLSVRQINRTVLERQLLLDRVDVDIPQAMQRVGGLQTQYAPSGYIGLWDRLRDFPRDSLTTALHDRSVVQATLMRSTIHMVAADDFWSMCAGIRESRREWWLRIAKSRRLPDIDYEAVARVLREVLADGPRPRLDLVAALERAGYPKPVWEGAG
ncbi:MAG TPA: crosslink repair DNA glycosylase YcaQ family protein, partial [Ilumatobacteraceae bacterium]|nr:crosslink repair DNA glycosylase YcaQ family protein [Ilumatobacteraceae bacterium]